MVNVIIVEDDPQDQAKLTDCLHHMEAEQGERFSLQCYSDPVQFLSEYHGGCDLIFLDIELPNINGVEAARQLREKDPDVLLVFVTNMEQFAVNGYEVDAIDFVVNPINLYRFSSMMRKALRLLSRRGEKEVVLQSSGSITRLKVSQIYYIEIRDHLLLYHTDQGRLESWGKLSEAEQDLAPYHFARCSSSYLVNLRHVISVDGGNVNVAGTQIPISLRRRKAFLASVTAYLSSR